MSGNLFVRPIPKVPGRDGVRSIFSIETDGFKSYRNQELVVNDTPKGQKERLENQSSDPQTGKSRWRYPLCAEFTHAELCPDKFADNEVITLCASAQAKQNDSDPCPNVTKKLVLQQIGALAR